MESGGCAKRSAVRGTRCERDTMIIDCQFSYKWPLCIPDNKLGKYISPVINRTGRQWQLFVKLCKVHDLYRWPYVRYDMGVSLLTEAPVGTQAQMTCLVIHSDGKKYTTTGEVGPLLEQGTIEINGTLSTDRKTHAHQGESTRACTKEGGQELETLRVTVFTKVTLYLAPNPSAYSLLNTLGTQLGTICKEGLYADFTMVAQGQEFKTHKVILAARSPVFRKMIEAPMRENKEGSVSINDFAAEVVEQMLMFIYSGEAPKLQEMVMDLLPIAEKYQLGDLKWLCGKELDRRLSVDNAAETLILADTYSIEPLEAASIKFISVHYTKVKRTPLWATVVKERQPLYIKVLEEIVKSQQELEELHELEELWDIAIASGGGQNKIQPL